MNKDINRILGLLLLYELGMFSGALLGRYWVISFFTTGILTLLFLILKESLSEVREGNLE